MKRTIIALVMLVQGILFSTAFATDQCLALTPDVTRLAAGNNAFAIELFGEIASEMDGDNIFFSPLSISSALGMTYAGARNDTELEMAEALHFNLLQDSLRSAFEVLLGTLQSGTLTGAESGDPFTLSIANGLWVQNGFNLLDTYVSEVTQSYHAAVVNLDMAGDPEGSRDSINSWISLQTLGKIQDLIPQGAVNSDSRLILTNAVYFKASWLHSFDEQTTRRIPFNLIDGTQVETPMMNQTEYFSFASTEGYKAIEMPYIDGLTSMLVIMPDDMNDFQENFDLDMLQAIQSELSSSRVELTLPRFEFTKSIQLTDMLKEMGMVSAFSAGSADFSGMTGLRNLFISAVLHKAYVKVDESGTEAAAATAVIMGITSVPPEPVTMLVDKPFIFLILDRNTDSIVFMGRVMDPAS